MIKMKALQSFSGQEGKVRNGREFDVASDARADDLVRLKLAQRVPVSVAIMPAPTPTPATRRRFSRLDDVDSNS